MRTLSVLLLASAFSLSGCTDLQQILNETIQTNTASCPENNTFQCASPLGFGSRDSDVFDGESRYYRFDMNQAGRVVLTLNPMPNSRGVDVSVHDATYNQVVRRRFNAGQPGSFDVNLRDGGRYYIELDPSACCSGAPYNYTIAISR